MPMFQCRNIVLSVLFFSIAASTTFAEGVDSAVLAAQKERVQVVEKVSPTVVAIFASSGAGGGSGVLISADGYALTNFHVVKGNGIFMKCGLNDGKLYDSVLVGVDPGGDVALVKLLGRNNFPHAPLGNSDLVQQGDWTFAMGNPFLLAEDYEPTVTYGIVSGVHRYQEPDLQDMLEYTDCIQVDTSINPGNSGGPLFDAKGLLIGINGRGSFEKRGRVNSGAGYAISINQIKNFMGHLRSGRTVDHATLGATVRTHGDGRIVVSNILEESDAYRRGLELDDEIVSLGGRSIRNVNQFKNIIGIYPHGWKIPLTYKRNRKKKTIHVQLRELHRSEALADVQGAGGGAPPGPPGRPAPKPTGPPKKFKHLFVAKKGFTNYYFNELEQKRTLRKLKDFGDFSGLGGDLDWDLSGKTKAGKPFTISLKKETLISDIGGTVSTQSLRAKKLAAVPRGSGGLLIALHTLRQFFVTAKTGGAFPEFYYLGTEPLDGNGALVDVIVTEFITPEGQKAMGRWYFDVKSGAFRGFDTALAEDRDSCRVRFGSELRDFNGRKLPASMTVHYGNREFATLLIDKVAFVKPTK